MAKWVSTEVTHSAHKEASKLLSQVDKNKASLLTITISLLCCVFHWCVCVILCRMER